MKQRRNFTFEDIAVCSSCCRLALTATTQAIYTAYKESIGARRGVYQVVVHVGDKAVPVTYYVEGGAMRLAYAGGALYDTHSTNYPIKTMVPAKYAGSSYGAKKYLTHRFLKRGRRSVRELIR